MLNRLVEQKQIVPHIPVFDRSRCEDGTFSREGFRYDEAANIYTCPADLADGKADNADARHAGTGSDYRGFR
jgi:hypothetical protein